MKKICYITTISLSIKSFFIPQIKYLSNNGFSVTVICSKDDELQKYLEEKVEYIPIEIVRGISISNIFSVVHKLSKVFKERQFDIVQYSTPNAALCASIASKLSGVKVRNYHMMGIRYLGTSGIMRKVLKCMEELTCKLSSDIECVSKSNLELGIKEGLYDRNKAVVVWNGSTGGVDLKRFNAANRKLWRNEIRQALNISNDDFVFGFVGRITRDKGINEILSAFRKLDKKCKLLIIGNQEGIDTLDSDLWEYAINNENIIIHHSVNDIEKYYAAIDILLLPSYREGFGMVIAEAAAVGTPAIVSDIPGPVDVIEKGVTALTVEVRNSNDLKDKMNICLENCSLVENMQKNCPQFIAEKFDEDTLNMYILKRKNGLVEQRG